MEADRLDGSLYTTPHLHLQELGHQHDEFASSDVDKLLREASEWQQDPPTSIIGTLAASRLSKVREGLDPLSTLRRAGISLRRLESTKQLVRLVHHQHDSGDGAKGQREHVTERLVVAASSLRLEEELELNAAAIRRKQQGALVSTADVTHAHSSPASGGVSPFAPGATTRTMTNATPARAGKFASVDDWVRLCLGRHPDAPGRQRRKQPSVVDRLASSGGSGGGANRQPAPPDHSAWPGAEVAARQAGSRTLPTSTGLSYLSYSPHGRPTLLDPKGALHGWLDEMWHVHVPELHVFESETLLKRAMMQHSSMRMLFREYDSDVSASCRSPPVQISISAGPDLDVSRPPLHSRKRPS